MVIMKDNKHINKFPASKFIDWAHTSMQNTASMALILELYKVLALSDVESFVLSCLSEMRQQNLCGSASLLCRVQKLLLPFVITG